MEKFKNVYFSIERINDEEKDLELVTENLKEERKKNIQLKERNEQLLSEIITINNEIKSLIPILPQNRLYPFPSLEELIDDILNFINIDSLKFYQKLHKRSQFPLEIIILHFKNIFQKCGEVINNNFFPTESLLKQRFSKKELIKPLKCVLNNSYQTNWKNIYNNLSSDENINTMIKEIKQNIYNNAKQNQCFIIGYSSSLTNHLKEYIKRTIEILLKCYINHPKIKFDSKKIGFIDKYTSLTYEYLLNENIVRGADIVVLLPSFYYNSFKYKKNEVINKDQVIKYKEEEKENNKNINGYKSVNTSSVNNIKINKNNTNLKMNDIKNKERKKMNEIYFGSKSYGSNNYLSFAYGYNNFSNYAKNQINTCANNYIVNKFHYYKNYEKDKTEEINSRKRPAILFDYPDNDFKYSKNPKI